MKGYSLPYFLSLRTSTCLICLQEKLIKVVHNYFFWIDGMKRDGEMEGEMEGRMHTYIPI